MAEVLSRADHENLMSFPVTSHRRAPGDTYATIDNEYHNQLRAGQTPAQAATARAAMASAIRARPDGK